MIKYERADGRFYWMSVQRDMFNDSVLTVVRGGIGRRVIRHYGYGSLTALQKAVDKLVKRRIRNGYLLKV